MSMRWRIWRRGGVTYYKCDVSDKEQVVKVAA